MFIAYSYKELDLVANRDSLDSWVKMSGLYIVVKCDEFKLSPVVLKLNMQASEDHASGCPCVTIMLVSEKRQA